MEINRSTINARHCKLLLFTDRIHPSAVVSHVPSYSDQTCLHRTEVQAATSAACVTCRSYALSRAQTGTTRDLYRLLQVIINETSSRVLDKVSVIQRLNNASFVSSAKEDSLLRTSDP